MGHVHRCQRRLKSRRKSAPFFTPLRMEALEERALLTVTAQLIKDINTGPAGISPLGPVVEMGGVGYFVGNTSLENSPAGALWRTDGTAAGTRTVKDLTVIAPGFGDAASLLNINGT